jgi:hypothetical protein
MAMAVCVIASGCSSTKGRDQLYTTPKATRPIPAECPLAKIRVGMTLEETIGLLGDPTALVTRRQDAPPLSLGLEWDVGARSRALDLAMETLKPPPEYVVISLYKGMGRVYTKRGPDGSGRVYGIDYDPDEPGSSKGR